MREVAECPYHVEHLRDRQRVEQARQLILDVRGSIARGGATQADGCLPDRLDAREPFLTGLRSQYSQLSDEDLYKLALRRLKKCHNRRS